MRKIGQEKLETRGNGRKNIEEGETKVVKSFSATRMAMEMVLTVKRTERTREV